MLPRPEVPEPHTVEVEATNHCNAQCSFCPHSTMPRAKGFLDSERFTAFLDDLNIARREFWLNRKAGRLLFPRVVFAGLGEPTLHKGLPDLVRRCYERGLQTQVVTNGSHLTPALVDDLVTSGLTSLAISLHSIVPSTYEQLMRLRLHEVLPRVEAALTKLAGTTVVGELWRVLPPSEIGRETDEQRAAFNTFAKKFPHVKVLGPSEPWERDGKVPGSVLPLADDTAVAGVWCHNLFFKTSIAWDGAVVLCCVDYHRRTIEMGNVFRDGFRAVQRTRQRLFRAGGGTICTTCRKWPDQEYGNIYGLHLKGES